MKTSHIRHLALSLILAVFGSTAVQAHHSIVGEFDTATEFEVQGTITDLEWFNPHIWFYMDVVNAKGETEKWQCEMGSPNQLIRMGWSKDDLPIGTVIKATANPARDGSHTCSTRRITLEDGTPVFSRASVSR